MNRIPLAALLLLATASCALGQAQPSKVYPIVPRFGGVVPKPDAAEPPRSGAKVVLDITGDASGGEVNKGLIRAATLLNLYGSAGLKASDVKIAVVVHGEATKAVLSNAAYQARVGPERNPNAELLDALRGAGVEIFVCGQALANQGYAESEVHPTTKVAASALTVMINRQMDGYASILIP